MISLGLLALTHLPGSDRSITIDIEWLGDVVNNFFKILKASSQASLQTCVSLLQ
jgi:hypothetical protein